MTARHFFTADSPVLDNDDRSVKSIAVGDSVRCRTLFGYTWAKVTSVNGTKGYAETAGLVLVLFKAGDFWCCNHSISKRGLEDLNRSAFDHREAAK